MAFAFAVVNFAKSESELFSDAVSVHGVARAHYYRTHFPVQIVRQ